MDLVVYGCYFVFMCDLIQDCFLSFIEDEVIVLKGFFDFIGFNYYIVYYVKSDLNGFFFLCYGVEMYDV